MTNVKYAKLTTGLIFVWFLFSSWRCPRAGETSQ